MPTYRGISFSLQTQYDSRCVPEYPPPSIPLTPSPRKEHPASNVTTYKWTPPSATSKSSIADPVSPRTAEVYIPIYPGSQFWIHYQCAEPLPTSDGQRPETRFFYFKLFLGDSCVLSWGTGEEDGFAGKVSFGVYQSGTDFDGRRILEKRGFFFEKEHELDDPKGGFEIRVFRAKARRREETRFQKFENGVDDGCGFRMEGAGHSKKHEPKKMYTYALIDSVDQPYATFKYHCRTGQQLQHFGFVMPSSYDTDDTPMSSPYPSPQRKVEQSPPAPAIPKDHLSRRQLSRSPDVKLSPSRKTRVRESSPVKKKQPSSRDAMDLSQALNEINFTDRGTARANDEDPPAWIVSKPLPSVPEARQTGVVEGLSIARSTSNVAGTLKGLVQNRLRRRMYSREEKNMS